MNTKEPSAYPSVDTGLSISFDQQQQQQQQHRSTLLQPQLPSPSSVVDTNSVNRVNLEPFFGNVDIKIERDSIDSLSLSPISNVSYSSSSSSVPEDMAMEAYMKASAAAATKKSKKKKMLKKAKKKELKLATKSNVTTAHSPSNSSATTNANAAAAAEEEDEEELRQKSLERNRLAASKCRQRKKEWVEELAHKADRMSKENECLKQVLNNLKEEMEFLKTQLLMHKKYDFHSCKNKAFFQAF